MKDIEFAFPSYLIGGVAYIQKAAVVEYLTRLAISNTEQKETILFIANEIAQQSFKPK